MVQGSGKGRGVPSAKRLLFLVVILLWSVGLPGPVWGDDVRARAALVMESSTGRVLYGKNPDLRLPPASTAKLMTAMVALDRIDVEGVVAVSDSAATISPIRANFRTGERVSIRTLLYAALIKSANDAAYALAESVAGSEQAFVELMNQKALALGMTATRFANATGLPGGEQYTTVYDLSRMMRHALRYPMIREIIGTRASNITTENGRSIFLKNINKLLWEEESMVGGKTGYTRQARHCFVCAGYQDNETIIVAVLGAPSREVLWKESEALLEKGFAVKNRQEEPVIYVTRSDYTTSIKKASYSSGAAKSVSKAKTAKKKPTKKGKTVRTHKSVKKQKKPRSTNVAQEGSGGSKG